MLPVTGKAALLQEIRLCAQDAAFVEALQDSIPELKTNSDVDLLKKEIRSRAVRTLLDNPTLIDKEK